MIVKFDPLRDRLPPSNLSSKPLVMVDGGAEGREEMLNFVLSDRTLDAYQLIQKLLIKVELICR